ncbi:MAG: AmmeMemoRadiSam system protein A [Nitrospirae bacterium]|nr:AmmeMemoRadiSam system protein A [Nitrospirota bacterium]NTW68191.1 AmmeMemoRadiSam system protein A [Nitrospirota bacterium]
MHPLVKLAKETIELYVRERKVLNMRDEDRTLEMKDRAGVFVSLKVRGGLRGCIGTFEPCERDIANEVIRNAISSATCDPRFSPIRPEELESLEYSVDVLTAPEQVNSVSDLDPKRYGVIVKAGGRRGLLLPDLEGVDTVEEQVGIAMQKAGIPPGTPVTLFRFEVKRYH